MTQPPYIAVLEYTDMFLSVKGKNIREIIFQEMKRAVDPTGERAEKR
jgi:hypothetical protein